MTFWPEVLAIFLGDVFATALFLLGYVVLRRFLDATDIVVSFNWTEAGAQVSPRIYIRNRSATRTYRMATIEYTRDGNTTGMGGDLESIWGIKLGPRSIKVVKKIAPLRDVSSTAQCVGVGIIVWFQDGRKMWLEEPGVSKLHMNRIQRAAYWIRSGFDKGAIPLE
jgi:hypothetical protein